MADAVEVHAHPDSTYVHAGALVVEVLAQGGVHDVQPGGTHAVGVLACADANGDTKVNIGDVARLYDLAKGE
jgi:hypothetical protein